VVCSTTFARVAGCERGEGEAMGERRLPPVCVVAILTDEVEAKRWMRRRTFWERREKNEVSGVWVF